MDKPALRNDIQITAAMVSGRRMLLFRDPLQLSSEGIALDPHLLPMLRILDGRHDLADIQLELTRCRGGVLFPLSDVESILEILDRSCLLDSRYFRDRLALVHSEFLSQQVRPAAFAGKSYPASGNDLKLFIEDGEKEIQAPAPEPGGAVTGIVAPHIDIQVAKKTYVHAYRHARERHYKTVVILGINHQMQDGLYSVSNKDYETPLGPMRTDKPFVRDLRRMLPDGTLASNDFGHKIEHSIEFQTVFLKHYLPGDCTIVPILCGSFHEIIFSGRDLLTEERFTAMIEALGTLLNKREAPVLLVAGVDFSHIGLKFGDPQPGESLLPQSLANDRKILACLEQADTAGILANALETQDRYKVCGLPALLTFSKLMEGTRGKVLGHEAYREPATGSAVTYASLLFTTPPSTGGSEFHVSSSEYKDSLEPRKLR